MGDVAHIKGKVMEVMDLFENLYEEHMKNVYAYFSICVGKQEAEDLTQQTFMNIYNYLSRNKFFIAESWKAWVFTIASNVKNDYLRKHAGTKTAELDEGFLDEASDDEGKLLSLAIRNALNALPDADREIILLKYMGISSDEAANIAGITSSAARSRLSAAKKRFLFALKEEGLYLPEGKNE